MSKQTFSPAHRKALWVAHNYKCFYCRQPLGWDALRIDHVVPEYLKDQPEELERVLADAGLEEGWCLTADHNLVPACDPCNASKGASLTSPEQLILLLTRVREKVPKVENLQDRFVQKRRADLHRAQLECALASGVLSEADLAHALAKAAAGDDLVQLTSEIEFLEGVALDRLRPSAIEELLDMPVRLWEDLPNGLTLSHNDGSSRNVRTAREYRRAVADGCYGLTTWHIKTEALFQTTLGVLTALSACRPSAKSFVRTPRVGLCDIELLPSTLLLLYGDDQNVEDATKLFAEQPTIGDLVSVGEARVAGVTSFSITIEFGGQGTFMREILRADLDGDGCEDLLISRYLYATEGTLGIGSEPVAIARRASSEPFVMTELVPSPVAEL